MGMSRIDVNLAESVMFAFAKALGFTLAYDRRPDVDEWTLDQGHGESHERRVGTRASICAFLEGYATMHMQTRRLIGEVEIAERRGIDDARRKLGIG